MSALQWVSVGFAGVLLVFIMWLVARDKKLDPNTFALLRFLCSICAGFAAAIFTGETFFKGEGTYDGMKLAISGTAGFGLFLVVWFTFGQLKPADAFHFSVPDAWTFRQTVDAIAQIDQAVTDYRGFDAAELNAGLRKGDLKTASPLEAIRSVRLLAADQPIRAYDVHFQPPSYVLEVKSMAEKSLKR